MGNKTNSIQLDKNIIKEIERRCNAARPGPWKSYIEGRDHESGSNFIMVGEGKQRLDDIELVGATLQDQDFIAHAKQDVPLLINEIKRLRKLLEIDENRR